jgi:ABC-type maltose transport system permease subunit
MDFLTPILNVPANRTLIKLVLVIFSAVVALVAVASFLAGYSDRLIATALIGILVRIVQAEVNHAEIKDLLNKK